MRQPFCILIVLGDLLDHGELRLIGTASTLADARIRIDELSRRLPGEYVIYDRDTGERLPVSIRVATGTPIPSASRSLPEVGLSPCSG